MVPFVGGGPEASQDEAPGQSRRQEEPGDDLMEGTLGMTNRDEAAEDGDIGGDDGPKSPCDTNGTSRWSDGHRG